MQGFMGKLYTKKPNPHYERALTFKALALNQTLRGKVHPTLIIQELQAIKYIKQHNISYQQAHEFVKRVPVI
jgi:hypothetical protein